MTPDEHAEELQDQAGTPEVTVAPLQTEVEAEDELPLTPERVLSLLIEEFGPLAPAGEEKLLLEADGAVIQDVVILGAIHLTSHRITFHASVPSSDPSNDAREVIRVGPAWVHRKGLHRKRRIWLELSHDFVSAFPSAREEDRIRPIRSIMMSSILDILPEDPKQPRTILSVLDGKSGLANSHLELDTIESAREWRREIKAAIFFARRRRQQILSRVDSEDVDGVRINIPLHRVLAQSCRLHSETIPILSLRVDSTPIGDVTTSHQIIELATFKFNEECLARLKTLVHEARKRFIYPDGSFLDQPVVVDFGIAVEPAEHPKEGTDSPNERSKDQIVCDTLAIEYKPDVWVARAALSVGLACIGYIVISPDFVGFLSKSLALRDVRYRLAVATIRSASKVDFAILIYGLQLEIEGQSSLRFRFRSEALRDEAIRRINEVVTKRSRRSSLSLTPTSSSSSTALESYSDGEPAPHKPHPPIRSQTSILSPLTRRYTDARKKIEPSKLLTFPKAVNVGHLCLPLMAPRHFVCLTIGSRGDVQPYIALGLGLKAEGHRVTIVTHEEYKVWIEGFGLQHRQAGGDPGALMKLSVENKMFSPQFFKTSLSNYRTWLDNLLHDAWQSCSDAEVLLESPYAMAGVHIAEALHIPYFRVCTMPWTKTTEFPHPFISGPVETPAFNSIYVLFDNIFWTATAGQINRWRKEQLHLDPTVMSHTAQSKIPILYNFSLAVVPKPLDWRDSKIICGYWFLDNPDLGWTPPESLMAFMKQARDDGKSLVYIGFGSITVPDPHTMTEHIYQAVQKSDVRAIVSKGWSSRMQKQQSSEIVVPKECYVVDKIPHDWLFPQIDAAMHHGGAGTTGASLRAGIPTLIKPWFGDQFFWASRVQKLGAGLRVSSLRVGDLSAALKKATTDRIMKEKANIVGQKVRAEDGVRAAIHSIHTYFPRAYSEGLSPE
ncbi:glycosyltransferase family 1 protein [Phlebiopsis gigantea 11061_1 CR5-6]|uniref:sterol 3beta-glucosyltransferase n=1 Tax=Phlebiopsis gigantea (strain 11061_1 CR5-6) TaxID=745531 RepID=A0A0C3PS65_PHLG1|nr:glycosyltransferase family 1 protein [Phlebiopsis gigantea 11061_1 CR5-6]